MGEVEAALAATPPPGAMSPRVIGGAELTAETIEGQLGRVQGALGVAQSCLQLSLGDLDRLLSECDHIQSQWSSRERRAEQAEIEDDSVARDSTHNGADYGDTEVLEL